MIKYEFYRNEINRPQFWVEDKYDMLWELWSCKHDYIKEIVWELEEIKLWKKENNSFWYEATTIICWRKKWENISKNRCYINYWFWEDKWKIEIPFDDIYNLMKDWNEYIEEWEKEQK